MIDVWAPFELLFYSSHLLSLGLTIWNACRQCDFKHSSSFHTLCWILIQIKKLLMANVTNYTLSTGQTSVASRAQLSGKPAHIVSSLLFGSAGWEARKTAFPRPSLCIAAVLRRKEMNTAIESLKAVLMAKRIHLVCGMGLPNRSISKGKCVIVIWFINYKKVSFWFLLLLLFPTHLLGCHSEELVTNVLRISSS